LIGDMPSRKRSALGQNRSIISRDNLNATGNNPAAHTAADIEKMR
jgi:hypothetical protein